MQSSVRSLIYEPVQVRHAAELYDELLDERIYRYTPDGPPRSMAALQREYAEFSGGAPAETGEIWMNWIVRDSISSSCIGTLQATRFADGLLWVGYKVVPRAWGAGVATSALRWLVRELNRVFAGQSLHAAVDTRNAASIRVLHKCGFVLLRNEPAELRGEPTEDHIYLFSSHK